MLSSLHKHSLFSIALGCHPVNIGQQSQQTAAKPTHICQMCVEWLCHSSRNLTMSIHGVSLTNDGEQLYHSRGVGVMQIRVSSRSAPSTEYQDGTITAYPAFKPSWPCPSKRCAIAMIVNGTKTVGYESCKTGLWPRRASVGAVCRLHYHTGKIIRQKIAKGEWQCQLGAVSS